MEATVFLVSYGSSIDHEDNTLSVFTIIDQITPAALPLFLQKIVLNMVVTRSNDEPEIVEGRISIFNNEKPLLVDKSPALIRFNGQLIARLRVTMNSLPVEAPGTLIFKYESNEINESFTVTVLDPPVSTETSSGG